MADKLVKTTHHEEPLLLSEDGGILRADAGLSATTPTPS